MPDGGWYGEGYEAGSVEYERPPWTGCASWTAPRWPADRPVLTAIAKSERGGRGYRPIRRCQGPASCSAWS